MKYTCAMCEQECESGWSEAEAIAEKERDFGDVPLGECDQVCDDCYQEVSPVNNPEYYAAYIAATTERPIRVSAPLPSATELADTEVIRAYIDAELSRKIAEWFEQEFARELLRTSHLDN